MKPIAFAQIDAVKHSLAQAACREKLHELIRELKVDRGVENELAACLADRGIPCRVLRPSGWRNNQLRGEAEGRGPPVPRFCEGLSLCV